MGFTLTEFEELTKRHGSYGSWAIWEYSRSRVQEKKTSIIEENLADLHSRYILIGLNISSEIETWGNFRGGKHDRKLKYAFNDSPIRGAYMTDLFKNIVKVKSTDLAKYLKDRPEIIEKNVLMFIDEMQDLKISPETQFIILGSENNSHVANFYRSEFQKHFINNPVIYHRHYSSIGTDRAWVESMWDAINFTSDFDEVLDKYK